MKLLLVAFLATVAVSTAINVGKVGVKKRATVKTEDPPEDPFRALCTQLTTFRDSWKKQWNDYKGKDLNYVKIIAGLEKSLGNADVAKNKIFQKTQKVKALQAEVASTNEEIETEQGNLESVKDEITAAKKNKEEIKANLKKEFDLTKSQEVEALNQVTRLTGISKKTQGNIKAVEKDLAECGSFKEKEQKLYEKFERMSKNAYSVEARVEKSFGVVEAEIKTIKRRVKTETTQRYNLDTGEPINTGKPVDDTYATETYKKVTRGAASVRAELKMDTNELQAYIMKQDKIFAAQVNAKQQAALDEKMKASMKMADKFMENAIADKTKSFNKANQLRFAGKALLKAVNDISEHLDTHESTMKSVYQHVQRFTTVRDQALACTTVGDCAILAGHTAEAFKGLTKAAAGQFSTMYKTLCKLEGTVAENYNKMVTLTNLKVKDALLETIIKKFNTNLEKLKDQYGIIIKMIEGEKTKLKVIVTMTEEITEDMNLQIEHVRKLVDSANANCQILELNIKDLADTLTSLKDSKATCAKARTLITEKQAKLFEAARQIGEIKTTAEMNMKVVVEKQAETYNEIKAANNMLNGVIKDFTVLKDKAQYFQESQWAAGGEKYFDKRNRDQNRK